MIKVVRVSDLNVDQLKEVVQLLLDRLELNVLVTSGYGSSDFCLEDKK